MTQRPVEIVLEQTLRDLRRETGQVLPEETPEETFDPLAAAPSYRRARIRPSTILLVAGFFAVVGSGVLEPMFSSYGGGVSWLYRIPNVVIWVSWCVVGVALVFVGVRYVRVLQRGFMQIWNRFLFGHGSESGT